MKFTRITVDPHQMGGVPCIRGLRIPVATVVGMVADGMTQAAQEKLTGHGEILSVDDVYRRVVARGLRPEAPPADAPWGERFFHILDPDGHELSVAQPLPPRGRAPVE